MDRIQVLLNTLSSCFLIMASLAAFYNFYKKNSSVWFLTGIVFLLASVNKLFDLDNRIVGRWLLSGGIGFINYMNKTLPWLKFYKQPGFVVGFSFMIMGVFVVIALSRILKKERLSCGFFVAGIVSFIAVVALGFNIATVVHEAMNIVILQFMKDTFETIGSFCMFISFLTCSLTK